MIFLRNMAIANAIGSVAAAIGGFVGTWILLFVAKGPTAILAAPAFFLLGATVLPFFIIAGLIYGIPLALALGGLAEIRFFSIVFRNVILSALLGFLLGFFYWCIMQKIAPIYGPTHTREEMRTACYIASAIAGTFMALCYWKLKKPNNAIHRTPTRVTPDA